MTPIRRQTAAQAERLKRLRKLVRFLAEHRAFGKCEICGLLPDWRGLGGAHIERRDRYGKNDTLENLLICCGRCHDHTLYRPGGLICGKEKAKEIVRQKNDLRLIESTPLLLLVDGMDTIWSRHNTLEEARKAGNDLLVAGNSDKGVTLLRAVEYGKLPEKEIEWRKIE